MFCKSLNEKYRQTSRRGLLRLVASVMVGIVFCVLAGCSETQPRQTIVAGDFEQAETKQPITYEPFIWRSAPPDDCPFEKSTDIVGIRFTGKCNDVHIDGDPFADTWYFSWALDDKLYSPFTDGAVHRLDGGRDHSRSWKVPETTGKDFGQQGYFLNFPSKFISENGRKAWLCYSGNYWIDEVDPPGSHYGLVLQEIELLSKEMYERHIDELR